METTVLAAEIAQKVVADTSFWVAMVGLAGLDQRGQARVILPT